MGTMGTMGTTACTGLAGARERPNDVHLILRRRYAGQRAGHYTPFRGG